MAVIYGRKAGILGASHRYYVVGFDRPTQYQKATGHRAARRGWDAEIEATAAADYFGGDWEARGFTRPRPIDIGAKV